MREIEIILDRPRKLRFRIGDLQEFSLAMDHRPIAEIMSRAFMIDPSFIVLGLFYGLRHEDGKITLNKVKNFVDAYVESDKGTYADLTSLLIEAMNKSGIIKNEAESDTEGDGGTNLPS